MLLSCLASKPFVPPMGNSRKLKNKAYAWLILRLSADVNISNSAPLDLLDPSINLMLLSEIKHK